jgi:hypothetical protein
VAVGVAVGVTAGVAVGVGVGIKSRIFRARFGRYRQTLNASTLASDFARGFILP